MCMLSNTHDVINSDLLHLSSASNVVMLFAPIVAMNGAAVSKLLGTAKRVITGAIVLSADSPSIGQPRTGQCTFSIPWLLICPSICLS